jgi:hypothetical protein
VRRAEAEAAARGGARRRRRAARRRAAELKPLASIERDNESRWGCGGILTFRFSYNHRWATKHGAT